MILGLGQEIYKIILENLIMPESAKLLKKKKYTHKYTHNDGLYQRDPGANLKLLMAKVGRI